jgi:hypothetical protein
MILKSIVLTAIYLTLNLSAAHADFKVQKNDPAFSISSYSISEIETPESLYPMVELPAVGNPVGNPVGEIITTIDSIIAIGQRIWKIVDAGRPVITTKIAPMISVLPHLEGENPTLNQMATWSAPKVKSFRISFKNGYNSEVVGFTYTIYFQFNGSYKNTGKYITNLKVQASEINVAWGFNFDATSELVGIANVGTMESPIASATMQISYIVKGLLNESRHIQGFYVDGSGNLQIIP